MRRLRFKTLHIQNLNRLKTGLSVLARCTFVYTNVPVLLPACSRLEESASELGFLSTQDF
jgi:hypothetical protein